MGSSLRPAARVYPLHALRYLLALILATAPAAAQLGQWSGPWDWRPQVCAQGCTGITDEFSHAALIPTGTYRGKVLLWRHNGQMGAAATTETFIFDPAFQNPSQPWLIRVDQTLATDIFCSNQTWDGDGELLVAGGRAAALTQPTETYRFRPTALGTLVWNELTGEPHVSYSPGFPPWIQIGHMAIGRFYPTTIGLNPRQILLSGSAHASCGTIPGGSSLVIGGPLTLLGINCSTDKCPDGNEFLELMAPGATAWSCPIVPPDNFVHPPGTGWDVPDHRQFIPVAHDRYLPLPAGNEPEVLLDSYPRVVQVSTGELLVAGDVNTFEYVGKDPALPNTPGSSWMVKPRYDAIQPEWQMWYSGQNSAPNSDLSDDGYYESVVILHKLGQPDRVLRFGGSQDTNHFGANPDGAAPIWKVKGTAGGGDNVHEFVKGTDPITGPFVSGHWVAKTPIQGRVFNNAVLTPTGEIVVLGGSPEDYHHGGLYPAPPPPELYDPGPFPTSSGSTTVLAQSNGATDRGYHSVALLLPDGRVLLAGGDAAGAAFTGELFAPPYLLHGFRPTLRAITPSQFTFGATFDIGVEVQIDNDVDRVVLIRPGAVTHHFDNDQRYIELGFTSGLATFTPPTKTVRLTVTAPADNLGPPGWYMLFAIEQHAVSGARAPTVAGWVQLLP